MDILPQRLGVFSVSWEVLEEDLGEGSVQTLPQTPPTVPETVDQPTPGGMEHRNSRPQEDLAVQVGSLISVPLVRCASSPNH